MPAGSMALPPAPIFTCVAVSGTCLMATRIFIGLAPLGLLLVREFPGDAEAVARDEDTIEDDRARAGIRDPLGLERGHAGGTAELTRFPRPQPHGRHGLARPRDREPELELEHLAQRRGRQVRLQDVLADGRR